MKMAADLQWSQTPRARTWLPVKRERERDKKREKKEKGKEKGGSKKGGKKKEQKERGRRRERKKKPPDGEEGENGSARVTLLCIRYIYIYVICMCVEGGDCSVRERRAKQKNRGNG